MCSTDLPYHVNRSLICNHADGSLFGFLASLNRRLRAIDLDTPLEIGAVLNADSPRYNVADHPAVLLDLDAVARVQIAGGIAVDDHFGGINFRIQLSGAPHCKAVAAK